MVPSRGVLISDDLSPWKADFFRTFPRKTDLHCPERMQMHPSAFSSPFQVGSLSLLPDCVTVGSQRVVCSQRRLWETFCVPGIRETALQDPFPKCSSFQSCWGQWMAALAEGMGQSRSCGHRGSRLCPPAQSRASSLIPFCCRWMCLNCKWI